MKRIEFGIATLLIVTLSGCGTTQLRRDQLISEKAKRSAAFDFGCPETQLNVTVIDNNSFGVEGCGKRAVYVTADAWCNIRGGRLESEIIENCKVYKNPQTSKR